MLSKTRYQKQTCVYWAPANTESGARAFDRYGKPLYTDPVEKDCRWEDTSQIFVGINGRDEVSKAVVMVDGTLLGGVLMLGELTDITDSDVPTNNEGAWEIRQKEKIPNRKADVFYEWVYL